MFTPPDDALCAIMQWYISLPNETTPIVMNKDIALRMRQDSRVDNLDPMTVVTTQGIDDIDIMFNLHVYLRDDGAFK